MPDELKKTTKQQLLSILAAVRQDKEYIPPPVVDKITEIAREYNNLINSETRLARDDHKGLLLSLVEELVVMGDAKHLNAPEVQARLNLMKPVLQFIQSVVITDKLKEQYEYRSKLSEGAKLLEEKMNELEAKGRPLPKL